MPSESITSKIHKSHNEDIFKDRSSETGYFRILMSIVVKWHGSLIREDKPNQQISDWSSNGQLLIAQLQFDDSSNYFGDSSNYLKIRPTNFSVPVSTTFMFNQSKRSYDKIKWPENISELFIKNHQTSGFPKLWDNYFLHLVITQCGCSLYCFVR